MIAMTAPISSAIHARVQLQKIWSSAQVLRYIRPNMTIVEVAIIAAKRAQDMAGLPLRGVMENAGQRDRVPGVAAADLTSSPSTRTLEAEFALREDVAWLEFGARWSRR